MKKLWAAAALTDCGLLRESNEDRVIFLPERNIFGVIDGMGGEQHGEIAAQLTAGALEDELRNSSGEDPRHRLGEAFRKANDIVSREAARRTVTMGAVALAIIEDAGTLYIGWMGDARACEVNSSGIRLLTRDHSPDGNGVSRFCGMGDSPDAVPSVVATSYDPAKMWLLYTDGVHGQLTPDQQQEILEAHPRDAQRCAERLIEAANLSGGHDNSSVIVLAGPRFDGCSANRSHSGLKSAGAAAAILLLGGLWLRQPAETLPAPVQAQPLIVIREEGADLGATLRRVLPGSKLILETSRVCAANVLLPPNTTLVASGAVVLQSTCDSQP